MTYKSKDEKTIEQFRWACSARATGDAALIRPILSGANLKFEDQIVTVESADGYMAARALVSVPYSAALEGNMAVYDVTELSRVLGLKTARAIVGITADGEGGIVATVRVGSRHRDITCKQIVGRFPDLDYVIPRPGKLDASFEASYPAFREFPDGVYPVFDCHAGSSATVSIKIGTMTLSGDATIVANRDLAFSVNPAYMVALWWGGIMQWHTTDSLMCPLVWRNTDDGANMTALVMKMGFAK